MGLPQIIINFKAAGTSAVQRSTRGNAVIILSGEGKGGTYTGLQQAADSGVEASALRLLKLCFLGAPAKVTLIYTGDSTDTALQQAAKAGMGGWICAPGLESAQLVTFIKTQRAAGKHLRAVVANAASPDCEGIVNFCTDGITALLDTAPESISTADYTCRIAGLLAGLSLSQSATYYPLSEVLTFTESQDPDADIDAGKLILHSGSSGARIARAVTSLVTTGTGGSMELQKIKIAEGVDTILRDIRDTFEQDYIGKVINDYDAKLLLVTAVNGYLAGLTGTVLDSAYTNEAFVDLEAQETYLQSHGIDTSSMSDTEILAANTGSMVFLGARVRFVDAMEDLTFRISM